MIPITRFFISLLALLVVWLHPNPATPAELPTPEAQRLMRAIQMAPKRGMLYEFRTTAATVYLYGTLHVGKADLYPLNLDVVRALTSAKTLYVEVDATDEGMKKAMTEYGYYGTDRVLPSRSP